MQPPFFAKTFVVSSLLASLLATTGLTINSTALAQESIPTTDANSALKITTGSEKVPAGTMLPVVFNTTLDSKTVTAGTPFTAFVDTDFSTKPIATEPNQVILPKNTLVRGRVLSVKRPGLFSQGGSITLDFDHVVLPSGDLLPLDLNLSANNEDVKQMKGKGQTEGQYAYYSDPGISHKVRKGLEAGGEKFRDIRDSGIETGKKWAGGAGVLVTAPAAVVGGAVAGSAISTGRGVKAVFGKGDSAMIEPGDRVTIDFGGAFNVPTQ